MIQKTSTGNDVSSDCKAILERTNSEKNEIILQSKVGKLFGKSIIEQCEKQLNFHNAKGFKVDIIDGGALDWVISARLEAALDTLSPITKSFLPEMISENIYETSKEKYRRSRLYLPGNSPKLMLNAGIHKPDGIILDLEDAVAPAKKHEARYLVRNALRKNDFLNTERMVRINQGQTGLEDLEFIIPHYVNLILIPKCESAQQVLDVQQKIVELKKQYSIKQSVWLMPIIESALGVIKSYDIATASKNVAALAIGLEDYTADIGTQRTKEGLESFYARSQIVNACKAAGVQAIDSVFSDISNMDALKENVLMSKGLGFDGMGCIHPRQIPVIHENFAPDERQIQKALAICHAFYLAEESGLGVVSLGLKMIDPPVVKRALTTIQLAIDAGKLSADWREDYGK